MRDLVSQSNPRVQVARDAAARIRFVGGTLPNGIYRADLLPQALPEHTPGDLEGYEDALESAFVPAEYSEGFPTLPSGAPLWGVLPWEPRSSYDLFEYYLYMQVRPKVAPDQGEAPAEVEGKPRGGMRILGMLHAELLKEGIETSLQDLQEAFYLYFWRVRAELFDQYEVLQFKRQRSRLAQQVDSNQLLISRGLTTKALDYINGEEFTALLTPKTAIELLRTGVMMERISAGLPASAPAEQLKVRPEANLGASEEDLQDSDISDALLSDPVTLAAAQELVIQMQRGRQRRDDIVAKRIQGPKTGTSRPTSEDEDAPDGTTFDGSTGEPVHGDDDDT